MGGYKLEMKQIGITYSGVQVLDHMDFTLEGGSVHALVGLNGAGKSTLMKVLAGAASHYTGQIYENGKPIEIRSPKDAKSLGIEVVYQEVDCAIIPYLSVAENVMLNSLVNRMGKKQFVNWHRVRQAAKEVLGRLLIEADVTMQASRLTLAQKQMILLARCVVENCRVLVLDEPTAPLSNNETVELFRVVRELAKAGVAIVFISHRMTELYEICEWITIMRDGKRVDTRALTKELPVNTIVEEMLGYTFEAEYKKPARSIGEPLLMIQNLTEKQKRVRNIHMEVHEGEIVGIAGLVGAGKSELCKTLFGCYPHTGSIQLRNIEQTFKNPRKAVASGFALVPEERRKEGLWLNNTIYSNLSSASMNRYTTVLSMIDRNKEKSDARKMMKELNIKAASEMQAAATLSGGNQQKVVVGKWLCTEAQIYMFDEPTKGIDISAKRYMYQLMETLSREGKGIIFATCEFTELLSICDRVYVMYDGEIVKELKVAQTNEKELTYYAAGGN